MGVLEVLCVSMLAVLLLGALLCGNEGQCASSNSETCSAAPQEPTISDAYHKADDVITHLTTETFDNLIGKDTAFMVMWYSPSCGFCKRLAPDFITVSRAFSNFQNVVRFAMIDTPSNRDLGERYEISGYPTLLFFPAGQTTPIKHSGSRSARALVKTINTHLGLDVSLPSVEATSQLLLDVTDTFEEFVSHPSRVVLVMWGSQTKQSDLLRPEFERLVRWSKRHNEQTTTTAVAHAVKLFHAVFVDAAERQDLVTKYSITSFPSISLFSSNLENPTHYEIDRKVIVSSLSAVKISEWLWKEVNIRLQPNLPPSSATTCSEAVSDLTAETFEKHIAEHKHTLVEFYAPWCGHCKSFASEYSRIAQSFRLIPTVSIARINADEYREIGEKHQVTGFPTIRLFSSDSTDSVLFQGDHTQSDVISFVNKHAGTRANPLVTQSAVVDATDETLDSIVLDPSRSVMILFYVPWCPHCKRAIPEFELAAQSISRTPQVNVTFARLDAEKYKDAARRYGGTHRYPTIEWFPKGNKDGIVPWVYMAPPSADHFVAYVDELTGGNTVICGGVGDSAGVLPHFESVILAACESNDYAQAISVLLDSQGSPYQTESVYAKILEKMASNGGYLAKEHARIDKLLKGGRVASEKLVEMTLKRNIITHLISLCPSSSQS